MAGLVPLVGEMLGVERVPIEVVDDGIRHSVRIGDAIDFEIEDIVPFGVETGEPVRLKAGQSRTFGFDFRSSMARFDVSAAGGPAAEIMLDGKRTGLQTPNTVYAGAGTHHLDLALEGWKTREGSQTVKLKGGQSQAISFTLTRP